MTRKQIKFFLLVIMLCSICGCVTTNEYTKIVSPQERINIEGVSLLPPQGEGWVFKKKHAGSIEFGKLGGTKDQSIVALSVLSKLPEIESKEEFLALISKQRSRQQPDPRFENILNKEILSDEREGFCIRFHTIYKDYGAKNLPKKSDYLIVEDIGITCRHPYNKNVAVTIALSQRTKQNNGFSNFELIVNKFIKNTKFIPFSKTNTELGYDFFQIKDYKQALEHLNQAIDDNPKDYKAYFYRAFCFYEQKKYSLAIPDWEKAISLKQDYIEAYGNLASIYFETKNYKKAISYLDTAMRYASNLSFEEQKKREIPTLLEMRTETNYELKNYDKVIKDYRSLIQFGDQKWYVYNNLVSELVNHNNKINRTECIEFLRKAENLAPREYFSYIYDTYGELFSKLGDKNKAIVYYKKSLESVQDNERRTKIQDIIDKLKMN